MKQNLMASHEIQRATGITKRVRAEHVSCCLFNGARAFSRCNLEHVAHFDLFGVENCRSFEYYVNFSIRMPRNPPNMTFVHQTFDRFDTFFTHFDKVCGYFGLSF